MDVILESLTPTDVQVDLRNVRDRSLVTMIDEDLSHTSQEDSILDLSQRNPAKTNIFTDNWSQPITIECNDLVNDDEWKLTLPNAEQIHLNLEQSLTDQYQSVSAKDDSLSDSVHNHQSALDVYQSIKTSE